MSDSELRTLEREARAGDGQARVKFFQAAQRSEEHEHRDLVALEETLYNHAACAIDAAQGGKISAGNATDPRFHLTRPEQPSFDEDDLMRLLARCVRRTLRGPSIASWDGLLLKDGSSVHVPVVAGALAVRVTTLTGLGWVVLGVRSAAIQRLQHPGTVYRNNEPAGFPFHVDNETVHALMASFEFPALVFDVHLLPTLDDVKRARSAMRRAHGGPLVRPSVPPPVDSFATWCSRTKDHLAGDPYEIEPTFVNGSRPVANPSPAIADRWASVWGA